MHVCVWVSVCVYICVWVCVCVHACIHVCVKYDRPVMFITSLSFPQLQMPDGDLHRRRLGQKLDPMTGELYTRDVYAPEKPLKPVRHSLVHLQGRLSIVHKLFSGAWLQTGQRAESVIYSKSVAHIQERLSNFDKLFSGTWFQQGNRAGSVKYSKLACRSTLQSFFKGQ